MILVCDGCREDLEIDYTPHFDTELDARECSIDNEWRTDGEHDWCPNCQNAPHDCQPDPEDRTVCARCGQPIGDD
jgi:hypothetical protein